MTGEVVEFCDTNVIVYAYDITARDKRLKAKRLLERLWQSDGATLSVQILQELFVTLTRKLPAPLSPAEARTIVSDLSTWRIVAPIADDVLVAIDMSMRWSLSFWDAMVLAAAKAAGATVLWSEDFGEGQAYDGIVVRNPLREPAPDR